MVERAKTTGIIVALITSFTSIAVAVITTFTAAKSSDTSDKLLNSMFNMVVQQGERIAVLESTCKCGSIEKMLPEMGEAAISECESDSDCPDMSECYDGRCMDLAAAAEAEEDAAESMPVKRSHSRKFKSFDDLKGYVQQTGEPWRE